MRLAPTFSPFSNAAKIFSALSTAGTTSLFLNPKTSTRHILANTTDHLGVASSYIDMSMTTARNTYLDHGSADESDDNGGYDSEAAEVSKAGRGRASKRRKMEHESTDDEADEIERPRLPETLNKGGVKQSQRDSDGEEEEEHDEAEPDSKVQDDERPASPLETNSSLKRTTTTKKKKQKKTEQQSNETPPGVVYLSSLPPYLRPSALRNLLEQRGFTPIVRLFLAPASKHKTASKKNSRQLYTEGWIEFASKKTARRCAETLNAQSVGGRKGGFYHDDVWNMKYLRGMRWDELMAGVREEKREEEGRRDEERRIIARETKVFVEGVEEGRRLDGIKRKRELKGTAQKAGEEGSDVKRTWRQAEVKGLQGGRDKGGAAGDMRISDEVKQVLGKIF